MIHPDLKIIENFVSIEEELDIINQIDKNKDISVGQERNTELRYGRYRPTIIGVNPIIPDYLQKLCDKLMDQKLLPLRPDVVAINEYHPGQGIKPHIDSHNNGNIITILGLNSHTILKFTRRDFKSIHFFFKPRHLIQMKDDLRNNWMHSIDPIKVDQVNGEKFERGVRYSIVFRKSIF